MTMRMRMRSRRDTRKHTCMQIINVQIINLDKYEILLIINNLFNAGTLNWSRAKKSIKNIKRVMLIHIMIMMMVKKVVMLYLLLCCFVLYYTDRQLFHSFYVN